MKEVYLSDSEALERFPCTTEYANQDGSPMYMVDPRFMKYLQERGMDLNQPVLSRRSNELGATIYVQDDFVIADVGSELKKIRPRRHS